MIVNVNDRLGTKVQIACVSNPSYYYSRSLELISLQLGSDTVGDFKKFVAAKTGRRAGEILMYVAISLILLIHADSRYSKRQGERPMKDQ
jgi:hypothetical protein